MTKARGLPVFLVVLDGFGSILIILAILGATGVDLGLPVLTRMWPFLLILGLGLMVPMVVWVVRKAKMAKSDDPQ
jgi:hypothetical protein